MTGQPIVAKCHQIQFEDKVKFIEEFTKVMNTGLAQARVEHPHFCKILDFVLDVDMEQRTFFVYHILEDLESDVGRVIEERKRDQRIPNEDEVMTFLAQTTQALAYAHSKQIAHRNLEPNNIFMDREGVYKIGDFASYFEKKGNSKASTTTGTKSYMSPQQRLLISGEVESYDAFKSDVFSLGMTTLAFATATLVEKPWPLASMSQRVEATLQELRCSQPLKDLSKSMMTIEEADRPTMQQVLDALVPPPLE